MHVHPALGLVTQGPQPLRRLALEIQFGRVLDAQHHRMRLHAPRARVPVRLHQFAPVHRLAAQETIGRMHFRRTAAGLGNTCRRLLPEPLSQQHQSLVQAFITQVRAAKLLFRPRHRLSEKSLKTIAYEGWKSCVQRNGSNARHQIC